MAIITSTMNGLSAITQNISNLVSLFPQKDKRHANDNAEPDGEAAQGQVFDLIHIPATL